MGCTINIVNKIFCFAVTMCTTSAYRNMTIMLIQALLTAIELLNNSKKTKKP